MANSNLAFNPITGGVEVQVDGTAVATVNTNGNGFGVNMGIKFPATQNPSADVNTLDDYEEGTWTGTLTGCTTSPTIAVKYVKVGKHVTLVFHGDGVSGTSNSSTKTITGMPSYLIPSEYCRFINITQNNGASLLPSMTRIETSGVINMYANLDGAGFTASGTFTTYPPTVSYSI